MRAISAAGSRPPTMFLEEVRIGMQGEFLWTSFVVARTVWVRSHPHGCFLFRRRPVETAGSSPRLILPMRSSGIEKFPLGVGWCSELRCWARSPVDHLAHRGERSKSRRAALVWSIIWIAVGLAFNLFVWVMAGTQAAGEYLAVYLIEQSLSADNMFLFLIIFDSLNIPNEHQHKALFWGDSRRGRFAGC
jgi:hypothetical protein